MSSTRSSLGAYRTTVSDAPVSYSVYSAFSFYGARRGGALPGPWLVAALAALGHQEDAVRQTLYRMERSRELESATLGRTKLYRLSGFARAEAGAGLAKIMDIPSRRWDGRWTLVQLQPGTEGRVERERLRSIAQAEGFAPVGPGLYAHPRDRAARLLEASAGLRPADGPEVFRARRRGTDSDRAFVARHWHLNDLARRYRSFCRQFGPLARGPLPPPDVAFVVRFAVVFEFLEVGWNDPDLPPSLLPASWPGLAARRLARTLYRRLLPGAIAFADDVLARVTARTRHVVSHPAAS